MNLTKWVLFNAFVHGTPLTFRHENTLRTAVILKIEREDGSGRNYNLEVSTVDTAKPEKITVFLRTND